MVKAADAVKGKLGQLSTAGVQVHLTGAPGMWSDFNTANRNAMLKSEVISWPVTLAILLLAFGSLVAAGLPLMLTMVGLASAAGLLYLGTSITPISIWAMNGAPTFALALGIDYALFVVHRFRRCVRAQALARRSDGGDDGHGRQGGSVQWRHRAHLPLGGDARAEPSVPFDEPRDHACGDLRARRDPDAAARRAGEARPEVDKLALTWVHSSEHRSAGLPPGGSGCGASRSVRPVALAILIGLALPVTQLKTAMPSIKVVPASDASRVGYHQAQAAFGPGATGRCRSWCPPH